MNQDPLIIHHQGCSDGICGALILWLGLGRKGELMEAQYGDDPPLDRWLKDREVWIVDFSYPRDVLERMNAAASKLTVLDHHRTAQQNCEGLEYCTFDMEKCGARLAYIAMIESGMLQNEKPELVDLLGIIVSYVEDRDLWRWELDNSREVSAWLASWPRTLEDWVRHVLRGFADMRNVVQSGAAILRSNKKMARAMSHNAYKSRYRSDPKSPMLKAMVVNAPVLHSEVCEMLLEDGDSDFAVAWRLTPKGYIYNLRSKTVDVSEIAKGWGGGGHAQAAGFSNEDFGPDDIFPMRG